MNSPPRNPSTDSDALFNQDFSPPIIPENTVSEVFTTLGVRDRDAALVIHINFEHGKIWHLSVAARAATENEDNRSGLLDEKYGRPLARLSVWPASGAKGETVNLLSAPLGGRGDFFHAAQGEVYYCTLSPGDVQDDGVVRFPTMVKLSEASEATTISFLQKTKKRTLELLNITPHAGDAAAPLKEIFGLVNPTPTPAGSFTVVQKGGQCSLSFGEAQDRYSFPHTAHVIEYDWKNTAFKCVIAHPIEGTQNQINVTPSCFFDQHGSPIKSHPPALSTPWKLYKMTRNYFAGG